MPAPSASLTAVVVSGGKQYRVAAGDRILVDRLTAEPGSEIALGKVLMVADSDSLKLAAEAAGVVVKARVLGHPRGPKIDVLRYKSKKRVRVHRGARADLSAIEILSVGSGEQKPAEKSGAEASSAQPPPRARRSPKSAAATVVTPSTEEDLDGS
ncbi:MAG: 50S ribosomal protein L21 [Candidatus Dormibacteraceae bacterium]